MVAVAIAGLIISALTRTGLDLTFSALFIDWSRGLLPLTLVMIMIIDTTLGTGIPTTPAYILTVAVGVEAMRKLGVEFHAAHLFAFYFAVIADITPPVAIAAFAGANIAGSDPFRTGLEASKIAIAGFIVPFMFVYNPALILKAPWGEVVYTAVASAIGVVLIAAAVQGWMAGPLAWWQRVALAATGLAFIHPSRVADLFGLLVASGVLAWQWLGRPAATAVSKAS